MARGKRAATRKDAGTAAPPSGADRPPLLSPDAGTSLVIADIVLRAAGGMLRNRMEKGLLANRFGVDNADRLVDGRSLVTTAMLYGASRLARRSPLGLAVVAGGLAAKVFYDRGKRLEHAGGKKPRTRKSARTADDSTP